MATILRIEDQVEIPMDLKDLADFRRWAVSEAFPERGRIDYVAGSIEVDMSPEDLHTHGKLKVELVRALADRVSEADLGELYTDRTRVSWGSTWHGARLSPLSAASRLARWR